jgi:glycosyltransferase involved in cell wall biosynthesis
MLSDQAEARVPPRTLAGATVLQIVPSLGAVRGAQVAVNVARALVRAGARAIIAGEAGPLVEDLKSFGGEWLNYPDTTFNFFTLKRNVERLAKLLAAEPIDIVHAKSIGAAWSALPAVEHVGVKFVTELPDLPYAQMLLGGLYLRAVSSGDRVIVHSAYDARPMTSRYKVPPQRVKVIPRSIDIATYDPQKINLTRMVALRQSWGVPTGARLVLVPGRIAPGNGQIVLVEAARLLTEKGMRGVTFVFCGDDRRHPRYVRSILKQAQEGGVHALFRLVGEGADMPTAFAAADVVVVPAIKPPVTGRVVAEAQAMGRPVIVSAAGGLPEYLLVPPLVAEDLRTGWVVAPGDAIELARALASALTLDSDAYRAFCSRARQSATYLFAPESVVTETLEVYNSLLQTGT